MNVIALWVIHHLPVWILLLIMVSVAYHLLALWESRKFRRRPPVPLPATHPSVSLLKPLSHWDEEVRANVRSFCYQDYPHLQVVLGPKVEAAVQVRKSMPCTETEHLDVELVICHEGWAINPKINQVLQMWPHVRHDYIILADQDIRVGPDYVRRVIAPLSDPGVGLVTCFHVVREAETLPAFIEGLLINTIYLPSMLVGRRLMGMQFALGATLATRRDVLEAIGGFEVLADYLADDYQLGRWVRKQGYRIELSDYVVESRVPPMSWQEMVIHQLRWARTNRVCAPQGWFFSIITHITIWSLLFWIGSGFSPWGARLLFATLLFRTGETAYYNRVFGGVRPAWYGAWLAPVQDMVYFVVWVLSFHTDVVEWAGYQYKVQPDGTMHPVSSEGVPAEDS